MRSHYDESEPERLRSASLAVEALAVLVAWAFAIVVLSVGYCRGEFGPPSVRVALGVVAIASMPTLSLLLVWSGLCWEARLRGDRIQIRTVVLGFPRSKWFPEEQLALTRVEEGLYAVKFPGSRVPRQARSDHPIVERCLERGDSTTSSPEPSDASEGT